MRSTLTDCYPQPEYKQEINFALIIYRERHFRKNRKKDSLVPHKAATICAKIENGYGVPPEISVRNIVAWGEV